MMWKYDADHDVDHATNKRHDDSDIISTKIIFKCVKKWCRPAATYKPDEDYDFFCFFLITLNSVSFHCYTNKCTLSIRGNPELREVYYEFCFFTQPDYLNNWYMVI